MLKEELSSIEHVIALAECFSGERVENTTVGPTDAGFVYIALQCFGSLINNGFIDRIIVDILFPVQRIHAMAKYFNDEQTEHFTVGPSDAAIVHVALRYFERLMTAGLIDPDMEF